MVRLHLGRRVLDRPFLDHLVDEAEILGHVGGDERVALQRVLDILERLTGVPQNKRADAERPAQFLPKETAPLRSHRHD